MPRKKISPSSGGGRRCLAAPSKRDKFNNEDEKKVTTLNQDLTESHTAEYAMA